MIKKNKPMRELVYEELKKMIIEGKIDPNEKIVEMNYVKEFNVSRTPIREAIRMLELEGLVENHPKGGVVVKGVTKKDVEEIYLIRGALEGIILEAVFKNITKVNIDDLKRLLQETELYVNSLEKEKVEETYRLFSVFNQKLYDIADLPRVVDMIKNITLYLKRFRQMSISSESRKEKAFEDHKKIVVAIEKNDLKKAMEINKEHLERSQDFIISQVG